MKKILSAIITTLSLASCATPPQPIELKTGKTNLDAPAEKRYSAMVQCVLDNVSPPATGQLFTYQSEKDSQLVMVYGYFTKTAESLGMTLGYDTKATLRYDGKRDELKIQNIQWSYQGSPWNGDESNTFILYPARAVANNMIDKLINCAPTYL